MKCANPYILTNCVFAEKCRKPRNRRARLVKSGFESLCEIDQKVKGTPFARFSSQCFRLFGLNPYILGLGDHEEGITEHRQVARTARAQTSNKNGGETTCTRCETLDTSRCCPELGHFLHGSHQKNTICLLNTCLQIETSGL